MSASARKRVVALGGVGIGVEVVDATCELLVAAGFPVEILTPPHAEAAVKSHYRDGKELTPDQGGSGTTKGFCAAALAALRNG